MTRRPILLMGLTLILFLITGVVPTVSLAQKYQEAPMLAELVKQGKLPPVEKRLPKEPVVIQPIEEIGQYGGTARVVTKHPQILKDLP